ncbi:GNAT family N-acetyltransferase [Epibacterium sp. SM1979]|uniref:GNAT family N-acetyltransferase n=1 Tax=Tritonibacter litoralis TaxID=2662264 RepID=A0A843YCJ8_9RHOB|nr:GNAT family N-acetyltransferase [Tritonibacter litoralis]MQQ08726.1 GNAT family N-acetyltransferase [Tritonibacter litoralis]
MWRPAVEQDLEWVFPFLMEHVQSSMFLLGNLRDFGLGSDAPYGLRLWVLEQGRGVFGISNSGTVLLQAPEFDRWDTAAALICDRKIVGVLGDAQQARAFVVAAGLTGHAMELDRDDQGFRLNLADLRLNARPDDVLLPMTQVDRPLLEAWRAAYNMETLGQPAEKATQTAAGDIAKFITQDSHRVLVSHGEPVAMTGFNTRFEDVVQIGGVFTPSEKRGQGHARQALAMHLAEARSQGATQAVLFSANAAASRAYEAVGFEPARAFALMLFSEAQKISTSDVEPCT